MENFAVLELCKRTPSLIISLGGLFLRSTAGEGELLEMQKTTKENDSEFPFSITRLEEILDFVDGARACWTGFALACTKGFRRAEAVVWL